MLVDQAFKEHILGHKLTFKTRIFKKSLNENCF
jgi:hypothetical protein